MGPFRAAFLPLQAGARRVALVSHNFLGLPLRRMCGDIGPTSSKSLGITGSQIVARDLMLAGL